MQRCQSLLSDRDTFSRSTDYLGRRCLATKCAPWPATYICPLWNRIWYRLTFFDLTGSYFPEVLCDLLHCWMMIGKNSMFVFGDVFDPLGCAFSSANMASWREEIRCIHQKQTAQQPSSTMLRIFQAKAPVLGNIHSSREECCPVERCFAALFPFPFVARSRIRVNCSSSVFRSSSESLSRSTSSLRAPFTARIISSSFK